MGMAMPKDLGKQPHSPAHKILSPNGASDKGCMRVEQGKGGGASLELHCPKLEGSTCLHKGLFGNEA